MVPGQARVRLRWPQAKLKDRRPLSVLMPCFQLAPSRPGGPALEPPKVQRRSREFVLGVGMEWQVEMMVPRA